MTVAATPRFSIAALERAIVQRIGGPRYELWFASRTHFRLNSDQLTVGVPNLYAQEYLQKKFRVTIQEAASEIAGRAVVIKFSIDPRLFQAARAEQAAANQVLPLRTVPTYTDNGLGNLAAQHSRPDPRAQSRESADPTASSRQIPVAASLPVLPEAREPSPKFTSQP